MTEISREAMLEDGRKQARIHGVDPACAPLYAEGWAAAMALADRAVEEAQRAVDKSMWDAGFNADLAAKQRITTLERQLRCVQLYGYGYLLQHGGEQIALDPKDVTVVLPASRHMDDFDLHNSLHLAEEKLEVLERRIARVREMCDLMVRVKDAQAILEVLDGVEDEKPCGEQCNQLFDHPELGQLQCLWPRQHVGEHEHGLVTWTMADHREDKADG